MNWSKEWNVSEEVAYVVEAKNNTFIIGWDLASGPDKTVVGEWNTNTWTISDKTDVIEVKDNGKMVAVKGIRVNDLFIHDALDDPDSFCISHVPTGASFMKAFPDEGIAYEEDQLIKWCEAVQKDCRQFWSVLHELTPLTAKRNNDRDLKAKDYILKHCLSIKVE